MSGGFWYLASPYKRFPDGLERAFRVAVQARGLLVKRGISCFSPIVHSHQVAEDCGIDPIDHAIWLPVEAPIMRAAKGLILLRALSWEESFGMEEERKAFIAEGKPVVFMDPGIVPDGLT